MQIKQLMTLQEQRLLTEIRDLEAAIASAPEGQIQCNKNGTHFKYFQKLPDTSRPANGKRIYIPAGNRALAEALVIKKYNETLLKADYRELKAIRLYLKYHSDKYELLDSKLLRCEGTAAIVFSHIAKEPGSYGQLAHADTDALQPPSAGPKNTDSQDIPQFLLPQFLSASYDNGLPGTSSTYNHGMYYGDFRQWQNASYEKNTSHNEHLKFRTNDGAFVRSKSEALIYELLRSEGIPFRYECALHLPQKTMFPDFTILQPEVGKVFIWEHFGMIDNENYRRLFLQKLELYAENKIYPDVNLIMTFETGKNPLDPAAILDKIHQFLLP